MSRRRSNSILEQSRPFVGQSISIPVPDKDLPITKPQARNFLMDLLENVTLEQEQVAGISIESVFVTGLSSLDVEVCRSRLDHVGKVQKIRVTVELID